MTPLQMAAYHGHFEVVQLLLNAGANPLITCNGLTPVAISAGLNHEKITELLNSYAAPSYIEEQKSRLLHAASRGLVAEIESAHEWNIAENGADALYLAVQEGHARVVGALLVRGVDPNLPLQSDALLLIACQNGNLAVVDLLLNHGADKEVTTSRGETLLIIAIKGGNVALISLLLAAGTNLESPCNGISPLFLAIQMGNTQIAFLLAQAGAHLCSVEGTAESIARKYGYHELVRLLTTYRCDAVSSLLFSEKRSLDSMRPLLTPDVLRATRSDGLTLLIAASGRGDASAVAALLQAGAPVNGAGTGGITPLLSAAYNGHARSDKAPTKGVCRFSDIAYQHK